MTHDDDARVADLLARLGDGDSKELVARVRHSRSTNGCRNDSAMIWGWNLGST